MMTQDKGRGCALRSQRLTGLFLAATSIVSLVAVALPPATAQEQTAAQTYTLDIPSKPLPQAIAELSAITGLQVLYTEASTFEHTAPALRGTYTARKALQRLLAGSDLVGRFTSANAVTLEKAQEGAFVLDPITVEGRAGPPRQAEIGNLPPEYAGGQVARGGGLGILGNRDMMDTPFNQTNYTSNLIEDQQDKSLGDVLANDPSVVTTYAPGTGTEVWNIRGLGGDNRSVAFGGLFGVAPAPSNTMASESIERVEVLKGASAQLTGIIPAQLTSLGYINIVPKRAGDEPLTEFTADYAMNSQLGGHLDVGRRFGEDKAFGARFNGVYRKGDTPIENTSRETRLAALGLDYRGDSIRVSSDFGTNINTPMCPDSLFFLPMVCRCPIRRTAASTISSPGLPLKSRTGTERCGGNGTSGTI